MSLVQKQVNVYAPHSSLSLSGIVSMLAVATALPQIYIFHFGGTYFPLHIFLVAMMVPFIQTNQVSIFLFLALNMFSIIFSGLWSSDMGSWANAVLYAPVFGIGLLWAASEKNRVHIDRLLVVFIVLGAVNAALIALFRFFPDIEGSYLKSDLINLVKNPDRVRAFVQFRPNVFDPLKAGGIFDNGNTAATFCLLCLGCAVALRDRYKKFATSIVLVFAIAIICTGSKSALMILVLTPAIIFLVRSLRSNQAALGASVLLVLICAVSFVSIQASDWGARYLDGSFLRDVTETSSFRLSLWKIALNEFVQHPVFGLGYGGWSKVVASKASYYGVQAYWPPHNSVISAWVDAGLLGVISLILLWLALSGKLLSSGAFLTHQSRGFGALFALLSVSAMSLGDPAPLLGNQNMSLILGILIAYGFLSSASVAASDER